LHRDDRRDCRDEKVPRLGKELQAVSSGLCPALRAGTRVIVKRGPGRASRDEAIRIVESTRLFVLAESLGGVASLVEVPNPMTHAIVAGSPLEVPTLGQSRAPPNSPAEAGCESRV
jgi:hypothetical protein